MHFANPEWLLSAAILVPLLYLRRRRGRVRVSSTGHHRRTTASYVMAAVPGLLLAAAVLAAACALARPQRATTDASTSTIPGRDIIMALDYSGSMAEIFEGELPSRTFTDPFIDSFIDGTGDRAANSIHGHDNGHDDELEGGDYEPRRIEAAQAAILKFVDLRLTSQSGDAIGLIAFDNRPILRWPLDRDLRQISRHGNFVPKGRGPFGLGAGTNFGTEPPGPIDAAAAHFQLKGQSTTRVLILVTDGEDELESKVIDRLERVIRDNEIRFYLIGVGGEIATKEVDIKKLCQRVGGIIYDVQKAGEMEKAFADIDRLESSPVPVTTFGSWEHAFMPFLLAALFCALAWSLCEAVITGR